MKSTLCVFLCSFIFPLYTIAQDDVPDETDRTEVKFNAFNLLALELLDVSYETLINEESSFGVGVLVNIGNTDGIFDYYRTFSLTPFYRRYFSKGYASGFFIEGFGMINSGEEDDFIYNEITMENERTGDKYTDFALGISIGGKFISKRGFVVEVYSGIGRNFLSDEFTPEVVGRGGVSLGFRF